MERTDPIVELNQQSIDDIFAEYKKEFTENEIL